MFGQSNGPQTPGGGMYGYGGQYGSGSPFFGGAGTSQGGVGSPFGAQTVQQQQQQQQQATNSPFSSNGMMQRNDSTGAPRRNYLPGYLSGGALHQSEQANHGTPDGQGKGSMSDYDSPSSRLAVSPSASTSRFGLFSKDSQQTSERKSPKMTFQSVREQKGFAAIDDDAPPIDSIYDGDESVMSIESPPVSHAALSPPNTTTLPSSSKGYAVTVFGFPSSALPNVTQYFSQFGKITSTTPSSEGGNWCVITYDQPWSAARAARRNGEVIGGVLMVGVKADEDVLRFGGGGGGEIAATTTTSNAVTTNTNGNRPSNVVSASQAFASTPRKGLFSSKEDGSSKSTPFQERQKLALEAQQRELASQQSKGVLGKVSDLVFGW